MSKLEQSIIQQLALFDKMQPDKPISAQETYRHVNDFSQKHIQPLDQSAYENDIFPHNLWTEMGHAGLKGIIIPEQYGGSGLGNLELCLATAEVAKASGAIAISYVCEQALCSRQIATFGTDEQKEKYLPNLASGQFVGALAMSEPNAGSDVMSMRTNARKVDGGYLVNGEKYWITNGARFDPNIGKNVTADALVLYAKMAGTDRLTAFIVDGDNPSFKAGEMIRKATTQGSDTAQLFFDNCFIPESNVLGEIGKGGHVLMAGLNVERLVFAANTLGVAQAAYEEALDYLQQREQFGMPVSYNQDVAFDLADMYSQIEMGYNYLLNTAFQSDINPQSLNNATAASVFLRLADISEDVTTRCQKLYGGFGQTKECRIDRQKGISALLQTGAGTRNMRQRRIAEDTIEGYAEHIKLEQILRTKFAEAHGKNYSDIDLKAATKQVVTGETQIINEPALV